MTASALSIYRDARRAHAEGRSGILRRQRERITAQIGHARAHSRYYAELYSKLPQGVHDLRMLPVTNKQRLMERFDDWITDARVTLAGVQEHVADSELVGKRLLGTYTVTTSSGTTGRRAYFVMSEETRRISFTLATRGMSRVLTPATLLKLLGGRARTAMLVPTGGHFASHVIAVQQRRELLGVDRQIFPVTLPMPKLVAELNAFRPAYVECYPTIAALLASEQRAGRLQIKPALLRLGGEGLTDAEYARIRRSFGAQILDLYGANEFPALMVRCAQGWYHVHEDWSVFEPVDRDFRPVPAGEPSHTVLVSVLYRREQPILRYDAGDSVLVRPDPCPCGSPFMAIKVRGRVPVLLQFRTEAGRPVTLSSFPLSLQVELAPGVELYQIVQTEPARLRIRLQVRAESDADSVWRAVHQKLSRVLVEHELAHVVIERGAEPPQLTAGGKLRSIIPLA